ncbi:MAG TPA: cyclic pyranopterin monophosphate synthase MoaC [Kiritimatiellia bacterium]|nr:cyclic pyranopterin monophosphate synthase MoaC [Kiritimatiellia bacterium]HMO97822.1 cyclic pyranopterin monophosphate synthase MoaC [Kiritimatiellia bacterium]HMP96431.1 cyclic pyranopterin monophosphate synthase MoaC [Kiritimatiellia bacterium]
MKLTHVDAQNRPGMVAIGEKSVTRRTAEAVAEIAIPRVLAARFKDGDLPSVKGPVFHTAIIAGTQAVKETSRIIPFCHPLPIDSARFDISKRGLRIIIRCRVSAEYKTGVEMEALTGASVAALTIIDMCKAVTHAMEIRSVRLLEKTGGKRTIKAS